MTALEEMATFIIEYCDSRADTATGLGAAGVTMILSSPIYPDPASRQAALYGYAEVVGATLADGFDPSWATTWRP